MAAITDNDGFALTGGPAATAAYFGVQFKSKIAGSINSIFWKDTVTNPTSMTLLDVSQVVIGSATAITDTGSSFEFVFASPPAIVVNGIYYACGYKAGTTYNFYYTYPEASYPVNRTNVNFTSGAQLPSDIVNGCFGVTAVKTTANGTETSVTDSCSFYSDGLNCVTFVG